MAEGETNQEESSDSDVLQISDVEDNGGDNDQSSGGGNDQSNGGDNDQSNGGGNDQPSQTETPSEEITNQKRLRQILKKDDRLNRSFYIHMNEKPKPESDSLTIQSETHFAKHLQLKLDKLSKRLMILQIKYQSYKRWYDTCNILIIIVSAMLSVFEAFRNEIISHIQPESVGELIVNLIPITVSTSITCAAAIIKFKKYQEKMENMQFTREKVILAISKIKNVQENLWFSSDKQFSAVKEKYINDIYSFYNESNSELERHIKFSDHNKIAEIFPLKHSSTQTTNV